MLEHQGNISKKEFTLTVSGRKESMVMEESWRQAAGTGAGSSYPEPPAQSRKSKLEGGDDFYYETCSSEAARPKAPQTMPPPGTKY